MTTTRILSFHVQNFRSIGDASLALGPIATLIGPNNGGKTNLLLGLQAFLSEKIVPDDFPVDNPKAAATFEVRFDQLNEREAGVLKSWLVDGRWEVRRTAVIDPESRRISWDTHCRRREAKDPDLKRSNFEANKGRLTQIVESHGLPDYFRGDSGRVGQTTFLSGLDRFCEEQASSIEWDEPAWVAAAQLWSAVRNMLPRYHYVPAVRKLEEELGGRTYLGELLDDLIGRILASSGRLEGLRAELAKVRRLVARGGKTDRRLKEIVEFERLLTEALAESMPETRVELEFRAPQLDEVFGKESHISVDDGVRTDATQKGHGLQRALMFAILRVYSRFTGAGTSEQRSLLFAIEEPELFLHPQAQRRLYQILEQLSRRDQVLLCTHSPIFVDVAEYSRIRIVTKPSAAGGTRVVQVTGELFPGDRKANFRLAVAYNTERSELFFSRKVLLVEGEADKVAFVEMSEKLGIDLFDHGVSVVEVGGKANLAYFMTVLGAFQIPHVVVYDMDPGKPEKSFHNQEIVSALAADSGSLFEMDPDMDQVLGVTRSQIDRWGKPYATHLRLEGLNAGDLPPRCVQVLEAVKL